MRSSLRGVLTTAVAVATLSARTSGGKPASATTSTSTTSSPTADSAPETAPNTDPTTAAPATTAITTGDGVTTTAPVVEVTRGLATSLLAGLTIKGRAPKTGYTRDQFGAAWADVDHNFCDTRNDILKRDLTARTWRSGTHDCVVETGVLADPYTGHTLKFSKTDATAVQIDHVVALSDAWQTGAQSWDAATRLAFANDPLNLLAVDGPANEQKSDSDAASWLPANKSFRCTYVARQVTVKAAYGLWVTAAEHDAIAGILAAALTNRPPQSPPHLSTAPSPHRPAPPRQQPETCTTPTAPQCAPPAKPHCTEANRATAPASTATATASPANSQPSMSPTEAPHRPFPTPGRGNGTRVTGDRSDVS